MSSKLTKLEYPLILLTVALLTIGLIAVYSSTHLLDRQENIYFIKQFTLGLVGIALMLTTTFIPYRWLERLSYPFYGLAIFLLLLVILFGSHGFGAERWLALGPVKLQPSEFAKLATIMAVARYLSKSETDVNRPKHLMTAAALILLPFVMIARQPDLGTSLVFVTLTLPLLFWAGLSWFYLFVILAPLITLLLSFNFWAFLIWMSVIIAVSVISKRKPYFLAALFIFNISVGLITPLLWNQLKPYQKQRILTFANPEADPKGAGYQIIQSKVAIGSGGVWGKGFLEGSQTQLRFLPAQHTDFIFSVIGEEWGFIGVSILIILFVILILYLIYLAGMVRALFASLILIGITTVLFFHIVINIGMTVGLAPVTGLPLPLISYGGSFLISVLLMMGMVLNLSLNRFQI